MNERDLEGFWRSARVSENPLELAKIGHMFLDACTLSPDTDSRDLEQVYLARTVWIGHRIEFLNIALRMKFFDFPKLAPTTTVPVRTCSGIPGLHPPHTWEIKHDMDDPRSDDMYWCTGDGA